ncbi:MAG: hypothetical protein LC679_08745 [Intrasporangiaceae bacterium]|nr:hypothetical protein [Intrasporangiaceae bacterium]
MLTAFYMSRWFFLIFLGEPRFGDEVHPHESPRSMTTPLIVLGVLSAIGGLALNPVHRGPLYTFLEPSVASIGDLGYEPAGPLTEAALIPIAIVAALLGIGLAYLAYVRRDLSLGRMAEPVKGAAAELAERRFFVDEFYEAIFVRAGGGLATAITWFDSRVIDGVVNGSGAGSLATARGARRLQSGLVRGYVAWLLVGALAIIGVLLVQVVR